jgi:energy-coupling factor transporter ATP-binding protein EcfA2
MNYKFRIDKITTKSDQTIEPKKINIIIGPNSCGKSRFLKDLRWLLINGNMPTNNIEPVLLSNITIPLTHSLDDLIGTYKRNNKIYRDANGNYFIKNYFGIESQGQDIQDMSFRSYVTGYNSQVFLGGYDWENIIQSNLSSNDTDQLTNFILNTFGKLFFNYVGTKEKLLVVERSARCGQKTNQINLLSPYVWKDKELKKLYSLVKTAFHRELILDCHGYDYGQDVLFRTAELGADLHKLSPEELSRAMALDDDGDGLKSFIATYLSSNLENKSVILIDEPEAFLHPPLARKMGEMIASTASKDKQIFITTHSPDLLKAILSQVSPDDVSVIRLSRDTKSGEARVLPDNLLKEFLKDHTMATLNAMNGLFAKKVYIVESESDVAVFQALYGKANDSSEGTYFVSSASGKDKMYKVTKLYKEAGVECQLICDFDFISSDPRRRNGKSLLKPILDDIQDLKVCYKDEYLKAEREIRKLPGIDVKNGGIETITNKTWRETAENMLSLLKRHNVHIIKTGELESCLIDYGLPYSTNKREWLDKAIQKIRSGKLTAKMIKESQLYRWLFED